MNKWLSKVLKQESAKNEASINAEIVLDIDDKSIQKTTENMIEKIELDVQEKTNIPLISDEDSITSQIKTKLKSRKKI